MTAYIYALGTATGIENMGVACLSQYNGGTLKGGLPRKGKVSCYYLAEKYNFASKLIRDLISLSHLK